MKTLFVVRHAKARGQEFDAQLTEEGRKQASQLAYFLAPYTVERIISSPFVRAKETITPFAQIKGIPIELDDRLGERVLSDTTLEGWKEKLRESFEDFSLKFPGGESNEEGLGRVKHLMNDLLNAPEKTFVLVSHGNLTTLILNFFDQTYGYDHLMQLTNPDVFQIDMNKEGADIKRIWS